MDNTKKIDELLAVLDVVSDEISGDLSVNQLMILLKIARNERARAETLMVDLMRDLGITQASACILIRLLVSCGVRPETNVS